MLFCSSVTWIIINIFSLLSCFVLIKDFLVQTWHPYSKFHALIKEKNRLSIIDVPSNDQTPFTSIRKSMSLPHSRTSKSKYSFKGLEEDDAAAQGSKWNSSNSERSRHSSSPQGLNLNNLLHIKGKMRLSGVALQEELKRRYSTDRKKTLVNYREPSSEVDIPDTKPKRSQEEKRLKKKQKGNSPAFDSEGRQVYSKKSKGRTVVRNTARVEEQRRELGLRQVKATNYNESSDEEGTPKARKLSKAQKSKAKEEAKGLLFDIPIKLDSFQGALSDFCVSESESEPERIEITSGTISTSDEFGRLQSSQDKMERCPVDPMCNTLFVPSLAEMLQVRLESFHRIKRLYEQGNPN
jgi:hypothetical protein